MTKHPATQEYLDHLVQARRICGRIEAELDRQDLGEELPKDLHWGHVGDMREIRQRLQEISDRLFQEGVYAAD